MNAPTLRDINIKKELEFERDSEGKLNFWEYWRIFRRHWVSVLIIGLAGFLLSSWYANSQTPLYSASVSLVIDPNRGKPPGGAEVSYLYTQQLFFQTQKTILDSREMAERTASKLTVEQKRLLLQKGKSGSFANIVGLLKKEIMELASSFTDSPEVAQSAEERNPKPLDEPGASQALTKWGAAIRSRRLVTQSNSSPVMTISFVSPSPEVAAAVANKMADAYIEYTAETSETISVQTGRWMAQQVERLRKNLMNAQNSLQEFQIREGLFQINEGLVDIKNFQDLTNTRLTSLNQNLTAAQKQFDDVSKRYGPKHPEHIRAKSELESARETISSESKNILLSTKKKFELSKLENDVESNREIYEVFLNSFRKMDFEGSSYVSPIYMLDRAHVPGAPFSPNKRRMAMIGLVGGIFLGLLLAWVREKIDNTFHNPAQLESELGVSVLGAIPLLGKEEKRLDQNMRKGSKVKSGRQLERYYIHNQKSPFAESINHIRTGILYSSAEGSPKTTLITSAIQSEGKTTFASNVALALSKLGSTLLIDADLRKPRVHQMTDEKDNRGGLVELLIGQLQLDEVLISDSKSRALKILKSGVIPPNPQEILSSKRFDDLLDKLKNKFDYIIVDCAPVLPVSDALVLSSKVDALILAVEANATSRELVNDALKKIRSVNAPLVGTVLSLFNRKKTSYYGRYRYYSKYYSYSYGKDNSSKRT